MSSQSSTSSLESLNESYTTKYGIEPYMHEPTISNKNNICYDAAARYVQMIILMKNHIHESVDQIHYLYVIIAERWKHQQKSLLL